MFFTKRPFSLLTFLFFLNFLSLDVQGIDSEEEEPSGPRVPAGRAIEKSGSKSHPFTLMLLDGDRISWKEGDTASAFFENFLSVEKRPGPLQGDPTHEEPAFKLDQQPVDPDAPFKGYMYQLTYRSYPSFGEEFMQGVFPAAAPSLPSSSSHVFSSAMILFQVQEEVDAEGHEKRDPGNHKVLAYLFGRWPSLLNVDTIVRSFGLRTGVNREVFGNDPDSKEPLSNMKEMTWSGVRTDQPHCDQRKAARQKFSFQDFPVDAGDSLIEEVRFQPVVASWGRSLMTAGDSLMFTPDKKMFAPDKADLDALEGRAQKFYQIFLRSRQENIYHAFVPYIDVPVSKELAASLTPLLFEKRKESREKWKESPEMRPEILYPHWTYWFRAHNADNKGEIFSLLKNDSLKGGEKVTIRKKGAFSFHLPLQSVIRSLPIEFEGKWYWFDRGDWLEISVDRTRAMKGELDKAYRPHHDLLPAYDAKGIESRLSSSESPKGEYKELLYNQSAVEFLSKEGGYARLMDRCNVSLTGPRDKFEFCDILTKKGDQYFVIHVKRNGPGNLSYLCTQAERCAMFLTSLDRSELEKAFLTASFKAEPSPNFFKSGATSLQKGEPLQPSEPYGDYLKKLVIASSPLGSYVDSEEFKEKTNIDFWLAHHSTLLYLWEHLDQCRLKPGDMSKIHQLAKKAIEESMFFHKDPLLPTEKRRKINIVVALIEDKGKFTLEPSDKHLNTNNIVRLYQALQSIAEKRLGFLWTTIPLKALQSLRDYAYHPKDIAALLALHLNAKGFERLEWQIKPHHAAEVWSKGCCLVVSPSLEGKMKPRTYLAKVFHHGVKEKKINSHSSLSILFPYQKKYQKDIFWSLTRIKINEGKITRHFYFSTTCLFEEKSLLAELKWVKSVDYTDALQESSLTEKHLTEKHEKRFKVLQHHPSPSASGPLIVESLKDFLTGGRKAQDAPSEEEAIKALKISHFRALRDESKNFEIAFREPEEGRETPTIEDSPSPPSAGDSKKRKSSWVETESEGEE